MRVSVPCVLLLLLITSGLASGQTASSEKLTLVFEGNKVFSERELLEVANNCLEQYSRSGPADESDKIDYCLRKVRFFLFGKGYLRAELGKPRQAQTENGLKTVVPVEEGPLYRLGDVEISGAKLFSAPQIREMIGLKTGDIASGDALSVGLYERLKKAYSDFGYIQFTAEVEPKFHLKDGAPEGVVDFTVTIDEGNAFTIRSIKFEGNGDVSADALRSGMLVRVGEVFNKDLLDKSLQRISQTGQFEVIDVDSNVDYTWDQKSPRLDLTIHLKLKVPATEALKPLDSLRNRRSRCLLVL